MLEILLQQNTHCNAWKKKMLKKNKQDLREQHSVDYENGLTEQSQLKAIKHCQHTQTNY